MLYSTSGSLADAVVHDADSYAPFKLMDTTVSNRIIAELNALADSDKQEEPSALVGALTKALCCTFAVCILPLFIPRHQSNVHLCFGYRQ